jgi:hypothetical protein
MSNHAVDDAVDKATEGVACFTKSDDSSSSGSPKRMASELSDDETV